MNVTRQRNWRWAVIEETYETGDHSLLQRLNDSVLNAAYPFWYELQSLREQEDSILKSMALEADYPEIYSAYKVYIDQSLEKYFIEALVMTKLDPQQIGEKTGFTKETIEYYERLFFDVRPKLDQEVYVLGNILGPLFSAGSSGVEYDHLWKAIGYFCGEQALESLWKAGTLTEEDRDRLDSILTDKIKAQTTTAVFARRPNQYNVTEIISDAVQLENLKLARSRQDKTSTNSDNYLESIHEDVLKYTELILKDQDIELGRQEPQLTKSNVNRDDYERPTEFI